jgi:argininosuccinate lyase
MSIANKFPAPEYKETVLAPLFEGFKRYFSEHLVSIHQAHGLMLAECGWLTAQQVRAILATLADVTARLDPAALKYTGEHEDFFFWLEAQLRKQLGPDLAGRLHTGRSRNDIDHTEYKMVLRARLLSLLLRLEALLTTLLERATRDAATLVVAYTHGQPAQPTTFGHYLGALIEMLLRDARRLLHAMDTVDRCSLGAAAITTSGFKLDRQRVAGLLGFAAVQENSYGCIAIVDYVAETYAALKVLCLGLGRFVQDLNSWTGFEIGHVHVPDAFVQISSIMPQKRNPVPVEHLRLMCSLAAGRADAVLLALHNTPFTDMNDGEGEVQAAGYEAFDTLDRALVLLNAFMAAIEIDEPRVRRHIEESCTTITEVADTLVREEGVSFRQAHEVASALARRMIGAGETLATLKMSAFVRAFIEVTGRTPSISEVRFREISTPAYFIAVRGMFGGPALGALSESLDRYRAELALVSAARYAGSARVAAADAERARLVAAALQA